MKCHEILYSLFVSAFVCFSGRVSDWRRNGRRYDYEAVKEVNSTVGRIRRKMQTESMVQYSEFIRDTLHWLPVRQRIHYRLSTIVWRCVLGIAPTYLLELFILTSSCTGRQSLRS